MAIYQHFRKEEHAFVDQVIEWKNDVIELYQLRLSDFLNPREQQIVSLLVGKDAGISVSFWGGNETSERKRALLYPPFFEMSEEDFKITCFEVTYPHKFVTISHPDVLGAMMSLGLRREKFGDILIKGEKVQLVISSEIADYVEYNLNAIGRAKVKLNRIENSEQIIIEEEWTEEAVTVSSLRLDTVLSEIYRTSRSKIAPYIEKGLVKINWKTIAQASFLLQQDDHISVRGLGRSKLLSVDGKTKRDKWRLLVGRKK